LKANFTCCVVMLEEIFGFDMLGAFRAGVATILEKRKGTHVILKDDIVRDCTSLSFKKVSHRKNVTRFIIDCC
jgi:hypothetical protein